MRLPRLLQHADQHGAVDALRRYYGREPYNHSPPFTGAWFDGWDSTNTRSDDLNRFTADDLVAVSLLSVNVPPTAAIELLDTGARKFSELLCELGADRDLAEESQPWAEDWPGWILWHRLMDLPGVGATTASKLLARKRPRLRPIYDSVVAAVIGSNQIWEPLRALLNEQPELHQRLLQLRDEAGLPESISPLRIFDVVVWMEGKYGPNVVWTAPQPSPPPT